MLKHAVSDHKRHHHHREGERHNNMASCREENWNHAEHVSKKNKYKEREDKWEKLKPVSPSRAANEAGHKFICHFDKALAAAWDKFAFTRTKKHPKTNECDRQKHHE